MHAEAFEFVRSVADEITLSGATGVDVGAGGDLGAKTRDLFPGVEWTTMDNNPDTSPDITVDLTAGPASPASDTPTKLRDYLPWQWDLVLCTEVFEHVEHWPEMLYNCARMVDYGGHLVITCAGPNREAHSGLDGGPLRPGEHYANVDPPELAARLLRLTTRFDLVWRRFVYARAPHDLYVHMERRS